VHNEPLALLIKIILNITAHFGHKSEEAMKAIWLSNDNALCNEEDALSKIIFF
jgi:hypothetical protein